MSNYIPHDHNLRSYRYILLLTLASLSGIVVMIFDTNVDVFCVAKYNRVIPISNEELFATYSVVFALISFYLLKFSRKLEPSSSKTKTIFFGIISTNQLLIACFLFIIYGQIKITSLYYNIFLYIIIYASLLSSASFLLITGIQFLRWIVHRKNYLVLIYALVMILLVINALIGLVYLYQVSLSHNDIIKYSSCRVMFGSLFNVNPDLNIALSNIYDITSIFCFISAWLVSVLMLKQYAKHNWKIGYWIIISLPLIFFLTRYEVGLYYLLSDQASDVLQGIQLTPNIYGLEILQVIINSNLQLGGALFGIVFFAVALKLSKKSDLSKTMTLTGIGMLFLFGSKDISALVISSYPPLGAISIGFIGLASYMVYLGIYSTARITARDKKFRADLRSKLENDISLLKSISASQDQIDIEKKVRHLVVLSSQWQLENNEEMSVEEIKELVKDVISELKR